MPRLCHCRKTNFLMCCNVTFYHNVLLVGSIKMRNILLHHFNNHFPYAEAKYGNCKCMVIVDDIMETRRKNHSKVCIHSLKANIKCHMITTVCKVFANPLSIVYNLSFIQREQNILNLVFDTKCESNQFKSNVMVVVG